MAGISIDIGTCVIKVVAYGPSAEVLGVCNGPAPVLREHPQYSEYDPDMLWGVICDAVRQTARDIGQPVDHISVTGQGDGCWLIDDDGRSVGNAILWNDGRGHDIVDRWRSDGTETAVFEETGSATFPGAQSVLLEWLSEHQSSRITAAKYALFSSGWLFYRLTGTAVVEPSDAGLPWLDIRRRTYSHEADRVRGLEWTRRLRPPLIASAHAGFALSSAAAADLGLPSGTPVIHAPFDSPAMAIGAGVVDPGETLVILGTTLIVESVVSNVDTSGEPSGMTLCTGLPDTWIRLFGTLSGTDSVNYMASILGYHDAEEYVRSASTSPPGANGVRILPYFSPAGERAPFIDSSITASVLGLNLDRTRADIARAQVEGLTYAIRHCLDQLHERPRQLVLCGGGSASRFWCQLIADVTGVEAARVTEPELGARGAFIVAQAALAGEDVRIAAKTQAPPREHFAPDSALQALYDEGYQSLHQSREALHGQSRASRLSSVGSRGQDHDR